MRHPLPAIHEDEAALKQRLQHEHGCAFRL
jgi:hypothetical protein